MKKLGELMKDYDGAEKKNLRAVLRGLLHIRQSARMTAEMNRKVDPKWLMGKLEQAAQAEM